MPAGSSVLSALAIPIDGPRDARSGDSTGAGSREVDEVIGDGRNASDEHRTGVAMPWMLDCCAADRTLVGGLEGGAEQAVSHCPGDARQGSRSDDSGTSLVGALHWNNRRKHPKKAGPGEGASRPAARDPTRGAGWDDTPRRYQARRRAAAGANLGSPGIRGRGGEGAGIGRIPIAPGGW